ncbi:TPA: hypothetical protein ACLAZ0_000958, partial [Neisseria meningitidis]
LIHYKSSLHIENAAQANFQFASLVLALSHGERGLGCRLPLRFRQILTSLIPRFSFAEAALSDDLLEHHRYTHLRNAV